jgi:hypothetical protein
MKYLVATKSFSCQYSWVESPTNIRDCQVFLPPISMAKMFGVFQPFPPQIYFRSLMKELNIIWS